MNIIYFILFAPVIGSILGIIVGLIVKSNQDSISTDSSKSTSESAGSSGSSMYHNYGYPDSYHNYNIPNYRNNSAFESEIKAHNARMEQLMREQNKIMIDNESRRISESIQRPLADMFDTRLTNIFKNPLDGIL